MAEEKQTITSKPTSILRVIISPFGCHGVDGLNDHLMTHYGYYGGDDDDDPLTPADVSRKKIT